MSEMGPLVLTEAGIAALAEVLSERAAAVTDRRLLVGVAGIPGAGKSTFAEGLLARVRARLGDEGAMLVPMDGFHLTNAVLRERGLIERKGSPETFDAEGYIATLTRFREVSQTGAFPIYDRAVHEPVVPADAAHSVSARTRVVLTEGNYLLLDELPWRALADVLDETWWLCTPVERARQWMMQRHRAGGRTRAEAERRYAVNDGPNMERVLERMRRPDRVVCWPK